MEHLAEIPIHMLADDPVQDHGLIVEELEGVMELPDQPLHVVYGVTVGQDGIVGKRLLETCLDSDLLLAHVAVQRPELVVVTGSRVLLIPLSLQGQLPLACHALDGIHDSQVVIPRKDPDIRGNIALLVIDPPHLRLGVLVQPQQHLEPLSDKLIALLGGDQVAFVGQMPDILGVVSLVDLPVDRRAVLRAPVEEALGEMSEAVVDELAGIAADVDYPLQVLEEDEGGVQVHSAVSADQGQPVDVAEGGRIPDQFEVIQRVLDLIEGLLVQVFVAVGESDHIDLPA